MKNIYLILLVAVSITFSYSQVLTSTHFIQASISDGEKLTRAYLTPLEHSMAFANSDGNINFTISDKKFAFNFGFSVLSVSTIGKDKSFDVNTLGLTEVEPSDPNKTIAQTFFGEETSIGMQTKSTYYKLTFPVGYTEEPIAEFQTAEGSGIGLLPLPVLNASVYAYGTHLSFNALAKINIPETNGNIYSIGFALQHNLGQFIKPISKLPFSISVLTGYQKTKLSYFLDIKPDETRTELNIQDNGPYDNQVLTVSTFAIPIELIISKETKGFNFFAFAGYSIQKSSVALKGNYPIYMADPTSTFKVLVEDITDPFSYEQNFNELKGGLGITYQLHFLKLKTNATFSKYFLFNMGLEVNL